MTIAQRLIALVATALLCLALLTGVSYMQTVKVYDQANYGNENAVPSIQLIHRAALSFAQARTLALYHVLSSHVPANNADEVKVDYGKRISDALAQTDKALKDYEALVSNEEDQRFLGAEKAMLIEYVKSMVPVLEASRDFRTEAAMEEIVKVGDLPKKLSDSFEAHMAFNHDLANKEAEKAVVAKDASTSISIAVFLAAAALLGGLGVTTLRRLSTRITQANTMTQRVAAGDLTPFDTAPSNDEIGYLLKALDTMRGDLARTIGEVVSNADGVAGSARHLSTSAREVSASTESQSASTATAASAVEEMTVSIDHIGASAAEASQQAVDAGSLAAQSEHDVDAAATQIDEVANQVERTAQQMQMLSEQLEQIGSISVVIREVADQTNLLALNAAIEAARAGEQGRGFAVVADEVRKLAERTTTSVREISAVIATIQGGAKAAVDSMQSSRKVVTGVVVSARTASTSMGQIRNSAHTVQHAIESISDALREQKTTSSDLARNVEAIAQMSEENAAAVDSVAGTAQQLVKLSDALKASVARFRL